jgi:pyruvate,orthophosphate dikinase
VGDLIQRAIQKCMFVNPSIMTIVTGEHCGDLGSICFLNWLQVNSIVCPPHKIPLTKIAAAQCEIRASMRGRL